MKALNLDENSDSKIRELRPRFLTNPRGQTLTELIIAVGIGSFLALAVASVFRFATDQFQILITKNQAEENLLWASFHTRTVFQQAVNLDVATAAIGAAAANGQILEFYDSNGTATAPNITATGKTNLATAPGIFDGSIQTIAIFGRETGRVTQGSVLRPTGVFFQQPLDPPPGATGLAALPIAGKLIFSMNYGIADNTITSGDNDLSFDMISSIQMLTSPAPSGTKAQETLVRITARYFPNSDRLKWRWGITSPNFAFREVSMDVRVGFRNNELGVGQLGDPGAGPAIERLHGHLYYFQGTFPAPGK